MKKEALRVTTTIPVAPTTLYFAWLDSDHHSSMTGSTANLEPSVGAEYSAVNGYVTGKLLILDLGRRIVMSWRTANFLRGDTDSRVEVHFETLGAGTRLLILHTAIPEGQSQIYRALWNDRYITPMQAYFSHFLPDPHSPPALAGEPVFKRLPWTLLPIGTWDATSTIRHFETLAASRRVAGWAPERLRRIMLELKPSECWYGADDFDGYVAFGFANVNAVALDNPLVGNALYVIRNDWRSLSRLPKRELLDEHRQQVRRIVHSGDWFERLKSELKVLRRRARRAAEP